jgi:hypothetical protein
MEDNKGMPRSLNPSGERVQPIALITQLMQNMATMHHVDEIFLWLANTMTQRLDIPIVQFWAAQQDNTGRSHSQIRAAACQNPTLPRQVYINNHVAKVIEHLFYERRNNVSLPIEGIFSPSQTSLFSQYNLRYWASFLLQNDALLPPAQTEQAPNNIPTPLLMVVTLFTQSPLSADQARATRFTLDQMLRIVASRGFLASPSSALMASEKIVSDKSSSAALSKIIPQRTQSVEISQASNPFAQASIIADKNARRLYSAIGGNKTVSDLAQITRLSQQELIDALSYLFQQQKIQFYTKEGESITTFPFS